MIHSDRVWLTSASKGVLVRSTKLCLCTDKRRCDPCAERDFGLLLQKCKSDPECRPDPSIVIDPSPQARERRTGFHRSSERGSKIGPTVRKPAIEVTEREAQHISSRVAAYQVPEGESLGWCCSSCGSLAARERPIVDEDGKGYCPRVGCDGTVKLSPK